MQINIQPSEVAQHVAAYLLEIGAIKLDAKQPFTWSQGWKSPIYCDNRLALSYPLVRRYIKEQLVHAIQTQYPEAEAIAGVATAGIPQGALVAEAMQLPFIYVRSKPKGHGMENLIEGKVIKGQKVVVLEDLVSTGGSSLNAVSALKASGLNVLGMAAIFTYGFNVAMQNFASADVSLVCLSDYSTLIEKALESGYVKANEIDTLKSWRTDPASWKPD